MLRFDEFEPGRFRHICQFGTVYQCITGHIQVAQIGQRSNWAEAGNLVAIEVQLTQHQQL